VLRRDQSTTADDEFEVSDVSHSEADRRGAERRILDSNVQSEFERRKVERRSLDSFRTDLQWTAVDDDDNELFSAVKRKMPQRSAMKPTRILLVAVALMAGGLAAFIASTQNSPEVVAPVTEYVQEARAKILVAKETISIGQRLSSGSVAWEDWPESSLRSDYITIAETPDAITDMSGSVARFEIFAGDPIRAQKLVQSDQGNLSAVLGSGVRGVSVSVAAGSASGGFINPNDHVDVVLTRSSARDELSEAGLQSETILHNVRVLAINARLGNAGSSAAGQDEAGSGAEVFTGQAMATLELGSTEAEVIINAAAVGNLSLVLRSVADFAESNNIERRGANAAIRISSPFWGN